MGGGKVTEKELQDLYGQTLGSGRPGSAGCVPPEALLALVRRDGPEGLRLQTLDHVMGCAVCLKEYELLRGIEKAGEELGASDSAVRRIWRMAPLALAASVLLLIGIGVGYQRLAEGPNVVRGGGESIVLLTPTSAEPANSELAFAWSRVPDAHSYEFELLDRNNSPVVSRTTKDTAIVLSEGEIPPGEYRWWVRAATPAGQLASLVRPLQVKRE
jgi:hypothetical protein